MDRLRIISDGLSLPLLFYSVIRPGFLLIPQDCGAMFPKEINKTAVPHANRVELLKI